MTNLTETKDLLTAKRDELALTIENAQLAEEVHALEMAHRAIVDDSPPSLMEAWGDIIPQSEYPQFDKTVYGFRGGPRAPMPFTRIDDRVDGKWLPYYETEDDLARIRAEGRNLSAFTSLAIGALESLNNYELGEGPTVTAQESEAAEGSAPEGLLSAVQNVLDVFTDRNDLQGELDRELSDRSRQDGEVLVKLEEEGRFIDAEIIEPDCLVRPTNSRDIEDSLQALHFASSWSFGVHTKQGKPSKPLGYSVIYNQTGTDGEYIPASRMEHWKRNTGRNAKRGVSDFLAIGADVERDAKLLRNLGHGAALLAAIALIKKHPPGTLKTSIESANNANTISSYTRTGTQGRSKEIRQVDYGPGTVIDGTSDYLAGPLGQLTQPVLIEVAQHIRRSIGLRWVFPEYMISGDASNANYSSTLVAESPFVKAREAGQGWTARRLKSLLWKVLRIAWERGVFDRWVSTLSMLERLIDVNVEFPAVASRDKAQQIAEDEALYRMKVKTRRSIAADHSIDYDAERKTAQEDGDWQDSPEGEAATKVDDRLRAAMEGFLESEEYP